MRQVCKLGRMQFLEQLIYYGADVNCRNYSGNTPLHVCAMYNQVSGLHAFVSIIVWLYDPPFTGCRLRHGAVRPSICLSYPFWVHKYCSSRKQLTPRFVQKDQRSRSHEPNEFSIRRRIYITDKNSEAEMLTEVTNSVTVGFSQCQLYSKTHARFSKVCNGTWLSLRSGLDDTMLIHKQGRISWEPFRRRSSWFTNLLKYSSGLLWHNCYILLRNKCHCLFVWLFVCLSRWYCCNA